MIVFRFNDGGFIMALLRWVYSYQLQNLIQEVELEMKTSTLGLHALMVGYLTFNMSLHHWPLIEISYWVFDFKLFIYT